MTAQEILLEGLNFYEIKVFTVNGSHIKVGHNLEIEVEANGLYKLFDDGYVVSPFNDINELCRFILRLSASG